MLHIKSIIKLHEKYSEKVQIPAKAIAKFFDCYFHILLPIQIQIQI